MSTKTPVRQQLADVWHASAQLDRADIFGIADALRPKYEHQPELAAQIDIPALGTVGGNYCFDSIALVSVNPAGGSSTSRSTAVDNELYTAFAQTRTALDSESRLRAFNLVSTCFETSVPTWTIWRQYVEPILRAVRRNFDEVAYLYLVPFRTRGDQGSKMPEPFLRAGYELHLKLQLSEVLPSVIIAVDRPSERFCAEWITAKAMKAELVYFTRKRDAHAERRELLLQLERRFAS